MFGKWQFEEIKREKNFETNQKKKIHKVGLKW